MAKSKFFRIAVEGATADGREITRADIQQMADSYNPATYTARINCEHLRGFSPDAPFNAYGSVVALKAQEIDLAIGGKTEKRLALLASLDANDQLVALNRKDQKLFTSCEVQPNFAGTKGSYLVGLAVTDSPASLGTEILKFAAGQGEANPFAARKRDKANLFTASEEATIVLEPEDSAGMLAGIKSIVNEALSAFTKKEEPKTDPKPEPKTPANDNDMAAFATTIGETVTKAIGAYATGADAKITSLTDDVAKLTAALGKIEEPGNRRDLATGHGSGKAAVQTNC